MIGQTLSHYRITAKLGEGGMGEVYRAEDTTLGREVALKILPPELAGSQERLERFQREAKTLAALDHPNIVTIFTVEEADGVHFLTMQLVMGRPLSEVIPRGGMSLEMLFKIAVPVSEALAAAHDKGIIHRDLKPANVMVGEDGRVLVLDFGLAKLRQVDQAGVASELPTEALTEEGRIVGTMPYMSPEQLEGRDLDVRTDIFSLGVMLHEMATGERPFKGETSVSLISSIVKDTPSAVDLLREGLPHHLGRVISRCLEKDPTRRYQAAIDVRNELDSLNKETQADAEVSTSSATVAAAVTSMRHRQWLAAVVALVVLVAVTLLWVNRGEQEPTIVEQSVAPEAADPMIAVLPFENLGSPEDEYFADGMTEEITSRLAMVSGLAVISRTSAMQYKEDRPSLKQIGEELGVDYVLEGTVRWAKRPDGTGRVRITPQLIRVADDRHLWADNIERELEDIFAIQAEIAQQVIAELGVTLLVTEDAALARRPTENFAAYEAYLRGMGAADGYGFREAARLFRLAVEEDAQFVEAHARLAIAYSQLHAFGEYSKDWSSLSATALDRAKNLAADDVNVQLASAAFVYYVEEDFVSALAIVERLAQKYPNNTEVLKFVGFLSRRLGRWDDSIAAFEQVLRLNPRDPDAMANLAFNYAQEYRYAEAEPLLERCREIAPDFSRCFRQQAWNQLYWTGDTAAARRIAEKGPTNFWNEFLLTRLDYFDRDYSAVMARLDDLGTSESGELFGQRIRASIPYALGNIERARDAARELVPVFEEAFDRQPDNHMNKAALAMLYAVLGEKASALAVGEEAIGLAQHDLMDGPFIWFLMAEICLIVGEHERAIELVDQVLATPSLDRPSHHWYRLDPLWDPVRDDPRFQAVLEKYSDQVE